MADYIKAAVAKIHTYLPPDAAKLQQIYGAGKSHHPGAGTREKI